MYGEMEITKEFIESTEKDFDLSFEEVEAIVKKAESVEEIYNLLDEKLRENAAV